MAKHPIGTVISGTHRPQDLIPAYLETLKQLSPHDYRLLMEDDPITGPPAVPAGALEDEEHAWWESDEAQDVLCALDDLLSLHAPPFTYFGAHEGDGSDFGFWVNDAAIEMDERDGVIERISDTSEAKPLDFEYHLHVNDHGNATLYENGRGTQTGELIEVWSVV